MYSWTNARYIKVDISPTLPVYVGMWKEDKSYES